MKTKSDAEVINSHLVYADDIPLVTQKVHMYRGHAAIRSQHLREDKEFERYCDKEVAGLEVLAAIESLAAEVISETQLLGSVMLKGYQRGLLAEARGELVLIPPQSVAEPSLV